VERHLAGPRLEVEKPNHLGEKKRNVTKANAGSGSLERLKKVQEREDWKMASRDKQTNRRVGIY